MDKVELAKAFTGMAKMQDDLNSKVNPSWRHAQYPWYRALWTELGEATDYVNWAWWKNVGPKTFTTEKNRLQFFLEMADALHFGISLDLMNLVLKRDGVLTSIEADYHEMARNLVESYDYAHGRLAQRPDIDVMCAVEKTAAQALDGHIFNASYFFVACIRAGLDGGSLIAYYHGKNILNLFRQENGYKQGTYRKNWGTAEAPHEDNVVLAEIIENYRTVQGDAGITKAVNSGTFGGYVRTELRKAYLELLKGKSDD